MSDDKIIDFGSFQNKVKDSDIDKLEEYMYSMYTNVSSGTMSPLDFSKSINEFLKKNNISVEKFGQMQEKLLERYGFDPKNIEEEISVGKRVIVPFGKGNKGTVGLVINILDEKDVETDIKFKEINMVIDEKEIVSKTQIKLAKFMSEKYITNLSYCLNCVLPPGDWSKIEEFFVLNKEKAIELSPLETEFFSKRKNILEIREFFNDDKKVNYLIENEILVKKYKYNNSENKFLEKFVKLNEDFDFSKIRKNAVKQLELLNFLKGKDFVSVKNLRENNFTKAVVDSLISMEALVLTENKIKKIIINRRKYKK